MATGEEGRREGYINKAETIGKRRERRKKKQQDNVDRHKVKKESKQRGEAAEEHGRKVDWSREKGNEERVIILDRRETVGEKETSNEKSDIKGKKEK